MKKITLLLILNLSFFIFNSQKATAQYVTIPDVNFKNWLTQNYPQCMSGNQMDTTCSAIVSETYVSVQSKNISDLTGIQYFDSLTNLNCRYNFLTVLPSLPKLLHSLDCGNNLLLGLPILPIHLNTLNCFQNQLTNLPSLNSLNALSHLNCDYNQLTILPNLPSTLSSLSCTHNFLDSLPTLPTNLSDLNCSYNQLQNLPTLPTVMMYLNCSHNQLQNLPTLPSWLPQLDCGNNLLTSLPNLPSLSTLYCDSNFITTLPNLYSCIMGLCINSNLITCLDVLPQIFPGSSYEFNISNNPLTCVPNQTSYSLGLPLCMANDSVNNPNNCTTLVTNLGVINSTENSVSIYPNPSTGVFTFKNSSAIQTVEVSNLYGEIILCKGYCQSIDLTDYPKGVYFAKVNGTIVSKLVKE